MQPSGDDLAEEQGALSHHTATLTAPRASYSTQSSCISSFNTHKLQPSGDDLAEELGALSLEGGNKLLRGLPTPAGTHIRCAH